MKINQECVTLFRLTSLFTTTATDKGQAPEAVASLVKTEGQSATVLDFKGLPTPQAVGLMDLTKDHAATQRLLRKAR